MSALYSNVRKKNLSRCTSTFSSQNQCSGFLKKNLSAITTKWCTQTFSPIFLEFSKFSTAISRKLCRHLTAEMRTMLCFRKSDPVRKKKMETALKSTNKPRHNACSNYAPLERKALRTRSVTKTQTPQFRTYSRRAYYDLLQTLQVIEDV